MTKMTMRKTLIYLFILSASAVSILSCKKDKTETLPDLNGKPYFDMVTYAAREQMIEVTPYGVTHPKGKGIGYAWRISALSQKLDTVKFEDEKFDSSYTFTTPKDAMTTSVICMAFAEGYNNAYYTRTLMVVDPRFGFTLTDNGIKTTQIGYYDSRDIDVSPEFRKYYYLRTDKLDWYRQNLGYTRMGKPYANCKVMSYVLGRYYSWNEAMTACPDGWRLPTSEEFEEFIGGSLEGVAGSLMVNARFNGDEMWEYWPEVDITNSLDFCAIPAGYAWFGGEEGKDEFAGINEFATFWTSDENPSNDTQARYYYLNVKKPDLYKAWGDKKSFGASVRCVRESGGTGPVGPTPGF